MFSLHTPGRPRPHTRTPVCVSLLAVLAAVSACTSDDSTTVLARAPALTDVSRLQSYLVNEEIGALLFTNSGGAPDTCALEQNQSDLPMGLSIGLSADRKSCAITGTPVQAKADTSYTVVATNRVGRSTAIARIAVVSVAPVAASCSNAGLSSARTAQYRVSFIAEWSQASNGGTLPPGPHFSPLIGATHNADYVMWESGGIASPGIESMAETGGTGTLRSEIGSEMTAGDAGVIISGVLLGSATGTVSDDFEATCDHPLVSVVSMLAPSPDWFVGVHGVSLIDSRGEWVDNIERRLYVYDAGTDSGATFTAPDADIAAHIPIVRLAGNATLGFDASQGQDQIGRMVFTRMVPAPSLSDVTQVQSYTTGEMIAELAFSNSGGAPDTCTLGQNQNLPTGLSLGLSANGKSCAITGTPTQVEAATSYTVIATSAAGMSRATVSIATVSAAPAAASCSSATASSAPVAQYRVSFIAEWSQASNGGTLPSNPHFSPLIGATHNGDYVMWEPAGIASPGIESMAETGGTGALRSEIAAERTAGDTGVIISGVLLNSATGTVSDDFEATCDHPLVSAVSMLAPSPDWFIGVHGVSLIDSRGEWVDDAEHRLYVYDAGTDSGATFTASNADVTPHIPIVRLAGNATLGFDASQGQDQIGRMVFTRMTPAPSLQTPSAQVFAAGAAVSFELNNGGGGELTGCTVSPALPGSLSVAVSDDNSSCVISGTPNAIASAADYVITATSAAGMSRATVSIGIVPAAPAAVGCSSATVSSAPAAQYRVSFIAEWSQASNGGTLPSNPHFSPLIGATHNGDYVMWEPAATASSGIESMAETGSTSALRSEIGGEMTAGDAGVIISGVLLNSATGTVSDDFEATCDHPLVSAVSMLAPSPDWFIGVHGVSLIDNRGEWVDDAEYKLYVYDAGTDSGATFTASNADITPHIPIVRLAGNATLGFDASQNQDQIGRMVFTRMTPAPSLQTPSAQVFATGVAVSFELNNGGGGELTGCTVNPALPGSLSIARTTDNSSCVISGTPNAVASAANYVVTATNVTGQSMATVSIGIVSGAPAFASPGALVYTVAVAVDADLDNTNADGTAVNACAPASGVRLPAGLSIAAQTSPGNGCTLSGTPTEATAQNTYAITVSNDNGQTTLTLDITVNPVAPSLQTPSAQVFATGAAVSFELTNSGGGELSGCTVSPALPGSLSIARTADNSSCVISGTPNAVASAANYVVTATSAAGMSRATVSIGIVSGAPAFASPGALVYTVAVAVDADLDNTNADGTVVNACAPASGVRLPAGLSIAAQNSPGNGCTLSGTPTEATAQNTYAITVSNDNGQTTLTLDITVNPAAPSLQTPSAQVFATGAVVSFELNNGGGGELSDCTVSPALPGSLSIARTTDNSSCVISGTPNAVASAADYVVTATNVTGQSMATVSIATVSAAPAVASCATGSPAPGRTAQYRVSFISEWSQANNGGTLPGGAHFSSLIGATHNADYVMWEPTGTASPGIESMAETGGTGTLRSEITAEMTAGDAGVIIAGGGQRSAAGTVSTSFAATCDHPLASVVSMLAPSPDWFIGVHGISLLDSDDEWVDDAEYKLYVYDAGTDSGATFTASNADVTPHIPIVRLAGNATLGFDASQNQDQIGRMVFTRMTPAPGQ